MKDKIKNWVKGFLTAYALTMVFRSPFSKSQFETMYDYVIASVYELIGEYSLEFVLIWLLAAVFFGRFADIKNEKKSSGVLAGFFSLCLLFGRSYYETGSWEYCLGSSVNFIKTCIVFAGYFCLLRMLLGIVFSFMEAGRFVTEEKHFFSRHAFGKSFVILSVLYGLVVIVCYPGALCWDCLGQIEQVIFGAGYSAHHPLAHTLLVGGLTQLGYIITGAYEPGLFVYMILQVVMLAAGLAFTIEVLARRRVSGKWLAALLTLYCVSPIYSNIVSVAIKDVPYCAFVIGYGVCFALLLETPEYVKNKKFMVSFVLFQLGAILFRNNGMPMVLLSGLVSLVYMFKKYSWKERLQYCMGAFAVSVVAGKLITLLLIQVTGAVEGSSAEMLSIPFQQTARYLQVYKEEITPEEKIAIEAVLGPVENIAGAYDPKISDPVKALYVKSSTGEELMAYFGAWIKGGLKHPVEYIEAFLAHVYGWFTPGVSSAIRYEVEYDAISGQGLFLNAQKIVLFLYRFADRISILGVLQNVGTYVWGLFFLTYFQHKKSQKSLAFATLPLWVSLLICMASPCFIYHPRYALPIIFLVPFLYGMTVSGKEKMLHE